MGRTWDELRRWRAVALTFVVAGLWAAMFLGVTGFYRHAPEAEENEIALHLARGDGFRSPLDPSPAAAPTAWSPPVYPAMMGQVYRALGFTDRAVMTLAAVNAVCFGVIAAALMQIGSVTVSRRAGVVAVLLFCLNPILMRVAGDYWDTAVALALYMVAVALAATWGRRPIGPGRAASLGALLGLLSLTNAAYALSYPVIVLAGAKGTAGLRRKVVCVAAALLAFVVVLTPWTWRNYRELGRLYYVRGGVQLELWNGNRPDATGWLGPESFTHHPYMDVDENLELRRIGEPAYFDWCGERFRRELAADPGAFVRRTFRRAGYLLVGNPRTVTPLPLIWQRTLLGIHPDRIFYCILPAAGLAGALVAWRTGGRVMWVLLAGVLTAAPYLVTSACDRYAMPLWITLSLFAALFVDGVCRQVAGRGTRSLAATEHDAKPIPR